MKDSCMLFEIQNTCGQRITHDYYNHRVHSLLHFNNNRTIFLPRIQIVFEALYCKTPQSEEYLIISTKSWKQW